MKTKRYKAITNNTEQPCWHCTHYCRGCEWSESKGEVPVSGWIATKTVKAYEGRPMHSYKIEYCPKYVSDGTECVHRGEEEKYYGENGERFSGEKLKMLIKDTLDLPMYKFATKCGLCVTIMCRYSTGKATPTARAIRMMSRTIGMSELDFIKMTRE